MQEGLHWGESPIDLPDEAPTASEGTARRPGVGWTCGVIAVSSAALLAFNSHALSNWASQQPVTARTAPIITAAYAWHKRAGELGLNGVVDATKRLAAALRNASWSDGDGEAAGK